MEQPDISSIPGRLSKVEKCCGCCLICRTLNIQVKLIYGRGYYNSHCLTSLSLVLNIELIIHSSIYQNTAKVRPQNKSILNVFDFVSFRFVLFYFASVSVWFMLIYCIYKENLLKFAQSHNSGFHKNPLKLALILVVSINFTASVFS